MKSGTRSTLKPARGVMTKAFSIVEVLVATTILLVMLVMLLSITGALSTLWKSNAGKITASQNSRAAFSTIARTLSRATLNTYNDYVDSSGAYRNAENTASFDPDRFARASELHFVAGPASQLVPGADGVENPGHAIFFQAPLGETEVGDLDSLDRTLNSIGFYLQYGLPDDRVLPSWLGSLLGSTKRFRLVQIIQPTEDLEIYSSTAGSPYSLNWLDPFSAASSLTALRPRVLAEDVSLLVLRPRLAPEDEAVVADDVSVDYDDSKLGAVLSPNYHYDSRAWQTGYPSGSGVKAISGGEERSEIMRNQVPPIVDVAMVSLDRSSLARFDQSGSAPPSELQVPSDLFTDASRFEEDLDAYEKQLSEAKVKFRVFRTSIEIQGSKWSNN